jgi:hypothetical protein
MAENLTSADFGLSPLDFIRRVFEVKIDKPIPNVDQAIEYLAYRVSEGLPRLEAIRAVERLAGEQQNHRPTVPNSLFLEDRPFINLDVLEAFAPENPEIFVDFSSQHILGSNLVGPVRTGLIFEIRKGTLSRREFLNTLSKQAIFKNQPVNFFKYRADLPGNELALDNRTLWDRTGREQIIFARRYQDGNVIACREGWHQPLSVEDGDAQFHPGWIFSGPKENLKPGKWLICLDISQEDNASLILDVIADCGLTNIFEINIFGSCLAKFSIEILPEYSFVEVRLRRPDDCNASEIRFNNFGIERVA